MAFGVGVVDTAKLVVDLSLKGNFTSSLSKATRQLKTFEGQIDRTKSKANQIGQHIGLGIRNIIKVGAVASATIAGVAVATLKMAGDFQAQLNTINTIAQATPEGLAKIGEGIRDLAKKTGTSLDDLTAGYYDLLSAGIKASDAQNVLTNANKLAIGGLATTAETVDLLTTAINAYGGDAKQAGYYTDLFAKAIELGKVKADQIAASFANVAPIAAQNKIEIKEIAAAYAALTAQGVPAAEVTTQMQRAILDLLNPNKALNKLQKETGQNFLKIAKDKGLVVALQAMRDAVHGNDSAFKELFGRVEGYKFALETTGPQQKIYNDALTAMGKAAGTAQKQFAERQQGLNFQLSRFKILVQDAGIQIGTKLLPKITPLLEKINDFIGGAEGQSFIGQIGDNLASLFTNDNIQQGINALKAGFQIAKDAAPVIAASAKITQEALKTAVGIFNSLPPEIRALAISAFAVNKLTGGLVTTVTGGLISAVLRQFTGGMNVTAGVVNVNGGVVNGGGDVPLPGGASGIKKIIRDILPYIPIAGIAAAASYEITQQANQQMGTNFAAPGSAGDNPLTAILPFGIGSSLQNIAEDLRILLGGRPVAVHDDDSQTEIEKLRGDLTRNGPRPSERHLDPTNRKTTFSGVEALRGTRFAPEVSKGLKDAGVANKQDIESLRAKISDGLGQNSKDIESVRGQIATGLQPTVTGVGGDVEAARGGIIAAIDQKDLSINQKINIDVNVSAAGVSKSVTVQNRYGPGNGSSGRDLGGPNGGGSQVHD